MLLLQQPRRGKSHALNLGIRASNADYIGFIDDDERVVESWFEVAHATLMSGRLRFHRRADASTVAVATACLDSAELSRRARHRR